MAKRDKKQRTETEVEPELNGNNGENDDSRSKKKLKKKNKRKEIPTVSMAVPASIIDNVPTLELATRVGYPSIQNSVIPSSFSIFLLSFNIIFPFQLAGQIARAATIFRINEVPKPSFRAFYIFLSFFFLCALINLLTLYLHQLFVLYLNLYVLVMCFLIILPPFSAIFTLIKLTIGTKTLHICLYRN